MQMRAMSRYRLLVWLAVMQPAMAQPDLRGQPVHRCVGGHGEIVFSGMPCAPGQAVDGTPVEPAGAAIAPAGASCPASREELRDRIANAIALHDANALAGLLRWRGVDATTAGGRLRVLRELVRRPLLALDADTGETDAPADAGHAGTDDDFLDVRTGGGPDGVREQHFGVNVEGGCYWLSW